MTGAIHFQANLGWITAGQTSEPNSDLSLRVSHKFALVRLRAKSPLDFSIIFSLPMHSQSLGPLALMTGGKSEN